MLPDGRVTLARLPGVPEPGPANAALCVAARHVEAGSVFVAGPGLAASALWASRAGARATAWTDNFSEAISLRATYTKNALSLYLNFRDGNPANTPQSDVNKVHVQADFASLDLENCDLALLHLPRGRALQDEMLRAAAAVLKPGSRLIFVGAKNEGIKGAVKNARAIFGHAGIVTHKGGYHAGLALRQKGTFPLPEIEWQEDNIVVDNDPAKLISCAGVFAAGRLDDGAAALIAAMRIERNARVLDLGCGAGVVALSALRRGACVECVDVSARAVAATRRTLAANGYPGAPVHLDCGASSLADGIFDIVVTNPPFHQGHGVDFEVSQLFVREAARVLKQGGKLYLVANAFLSYRSWLEAGFSRVGITWEDKRFRVWEAIK